jgi:hypothetical protein
LDLQRSDAEPVRALPYTLPLFTLRTNLKAAYADPSKMTGARCSRRAIWMLAPGFGGRVIA